MTQFSHDQLMALWVNAGGPDNYADVAAAIAQAESGGDSTAILNTAYPSKPGYKKPPAGASPEYSVGLWQVNLLAHPTYTEAGMLDPAKNAAAAVAISDHGINFTPWSTFMNGAYLAYVSGASPGGSLTFTPGPSADTSAAQAHRGWHQINLALSRSLPAAIFHSERLGASTAKLLFRRPK